MFTLTLQVGFSDFCFLLFDMSPYFDVFQRGAQFYAVRLFIRDDESQANYLLNSVLTLVEDKRYTADIIISRSARRLSRYPIEILLVMGAAYLEYILTKEASRFNQGRA